MKRLAALVMLCLPLTTSADELDPHNLAIDKVGTLTPYGEQPNKKVIGRVVYHVEAVGSDWLAVRAHSLEKERKSDVIFVVRGIPTRGIVDDKPWKPEGEWIVSGTEKHNEKTVFTLTRPKKK